MKKRARACLANLGNTSEGRRMWGGPVWHLKNYWIYGRPSLTLREFMGGPVLVL